jgi:hypothetical protein
LLQVWPLQAWLLAWLQVLQRLVWRPQASWQQVWPQVLQRLAWRRFLQQQAWRRQWQAWRLVSQRQS